MKNTAKRLLCIVLCLLLVGQAVVILAACNNKLNPEKTPLVLSTDALDGVFNPFSYTSGADGGVVSQTQLGMLNIDKDGNVVAGWDQPTVAEAYSVKTVGTEEDYTRDGNYDNYYTDYYFVIKDGIKFSNGSDLTIKDVLFNMYVYLDPVYTGSSTMYSIDIQGLSAYRTQSGADGAQNNLNSQARAQASQRLERLIDWCDYGEGTTIEEYFKDYGTDRFGVNILDEVKADVARIQNLFKEELNSDWVAAASMVEDYEKYYLRNSETNAITTPSAWNEYTKEGNTHKHMTQQWEVFLAMYGQISTYSEKLGEGTGSVRKYTFEYNQSDTYDHSQSALVERVYRGFFPSDNPTKDSSKSFREKLGQVVTLYATANTFFEYAVSNEKEKILNEFDVLEYPNISGIQVMLANSIPESSVSSGMTSFNTKKTILKIRINGVDPKALFSFSFSVAPMSYYSTPSAIANFKELDDVLDQETGIIYKQYSGFGVEYASTDFMNAINTNLVPMGAGPYRPSNGTKKGLADDKSPARGEFFRNNIVNFERNNYFHTVMKDGHDANIKFLRYKVIASNAMVDAVTGKNPEVHVSNPAATNEIEQETRELAGVKAVKVDYMGYGYIGINASYVHSRLVRQAIMHAMNVELCRSYYGSDDLVSIIYRSMSTNSWAYPETATEQYYKFDETGETSLNLVREAGFDETNSRGVLYNRSTGEQLKFTFTVAGETEDHPAYQTMAKAAEILNSIGFDITVTKDTQALSKLASGGLQVWAAAWSSSIDPDMYQVYHKDSTASSVKNWGYPYLLREGDAEEQQILDDLAEQIELGRKYMDKDKRKEYYWKALDYVMDLAVELPTYQRRDLYAFNTKIIDASTLVQGDDLTPFNGPLARLWEVSFVNQK